MSTEDANRAVERVLSVTWRFDASRLSSHAALVEEFLRRSALWAETLGVPERWPFFDVAEYDTPDAPETSELIERLRAALPASLHPDLRKTCEWYVRWEACKGGRAFEGLRLPAPYEPLLLMYERGGTFWREDIYIDLAPVSIPASDWRAYRSDEPRAVLSEAELDRLDSPGGHA